MITRGSTVRRASSVQVAIALRDAITRLNRRLRRARPMGDLTIAQLSALQSLDTAGALTPRELAEIERVQPPTMTRIIARLEERALVQRSPHPTDRRQVILAASPVGRALIAENRRLREEWLAKRISMLEAEEREVLQRAAEIMTRIAKD